MSFLDKIYVLIVLREFARKQLLYRREKEFLDLFHSLKVSCRSGKEYKRNKYIEKLI
jgi:hypothetical protein